MSGKQPHLNGAYYGHAVPSAVQTYHRHGHGRGCGCCLFTTFLKIVIAFIILAGVAVLIIWLVFRPNKVKFHVTDAELTQFNFTGDQLHYNLGLKITIRNPNRRIGIYYDTIEATALYKGQRFDTLWLTPFYQGYKTTSVVSPKFEGQQVVLLGGEGHGEFNTEKLAGVYGMDVKLRLRIRLKFWVVRIGKLKPKAGCEFKVPLSSGGKAVTPFQTAGCDVDYY